MGTIPLFHVWEMYSVSSSKGQSLPGALFFEFGVMTWFIYGLLKKDRIIMICNGIAVLFGLIYISTIIYYSI
ncbi:MAG: SemiSWEET family transporter [Desulfomonilaceae bacterium]